MAFARARKGYVAAAAVPAAGWLAALLSLLLHPARDFVAIRFIQSAQRKLSSRPVDRRSAADDVRRALEVAPANLLVQRRAPDLLVMAEDYKTALQLFEKQRPSDILARITWGQCLLMTGDKARGERIILQAAAEAKLRYRSGRASSALFALAMNNAGYSLADADVDLELAEALTRRAVALAPLEPSFCDSLGWALLKLGKDHEATFYLERALRQQLPRPDPLIVYHLGIAYARQRRIPLARRMLTWALALDPARTEALRALRDMLYMLPEPTMANVLPDFTSP